jgi:aspartate carbamoyltransferase catalytic subunit
MSGRGRERGRGQFGGQSRGGRFESSSTKKEETAKPRKTLADYIFYTGSTRTASEFEVVSQFI